MALFLDILFLLGGMALILLGANGLTDGSSSVAKRFGISDLVIGLTIVAFGTSAPELMVSLVSSIKGSAQLAIGNVVGSNIFNILMIVGLTAVVMPIKVQKNTITNEIPLVLLSSLALVACASDIVLDGGVGNVIGRGDGILLLLFFSIFMRYTFSIAKSSGEESGEQIKLMPIWKSLLFIVLGLAGLIVGGQLFVDGASGIARSLGVSESVIGLTLVAGGTSLPELATSVVAAVKKKPGIAIGNVIGSNLFNIFLVLGASATVSPLPLGNIGISDMLMLVVSSILFWAAGWFFKDKTITRIEGAIMVALYVGYIWWLISGC
ncbi:MAG: calcium/sodium antiporter [Bacteroidales bacterium]|nr:calcium/sodium antiporter [Bacteroidales bacterium]